MTFRQGGHDVVADVDSKQVPRFYAGRACAAIILNVVSLRKGAPTPTRKPEWQWPISSTQAAARPTAAIRI